MIRTLLPDYVHPTLGRFTRYRTTKHLGEVFVELEKVGSTEIPGLAYVFDEFSISLRDTDEPPAPMLEDLVQIIQWPRARRGEIEERIFSYYTENRERWLEDTEELVADPEIIRSIESRSDVWKLIVRPLFINAGQWPQASIAFECAFDIEHEMHISFANGAVCEVWNE